ncbi:MAG: hypothetical protein ABIA04_11095 [Pseudomonadota bacterium]
MKYLNNYMICIFLILTISNIFPQSAILCDMVTNEGNELADLLTEEVWKASIPKNLKIETIRFNGKEYENLKLSNLTEYYLNAESLDPNGDLFNTDINPFPCYQSLIKLLLKDLGDLYSFSLFVVPYFTQEFTRLQRIASSLSRKLAPNAISNLFYFAFMSDQDGNANGIVVDFNDKIKSENCDLIKIYGKGYHYIP